MSKNGNPDGYVLSRIAGEYERLCGQAESRSPCTQRVLAQAGLDTGITALDAGCDPGEVMRLMARRVGPSRSETGVNIDPERAPAAGPDYMQCHFVPWPENGTSDNQQEFLVRWQTPAASVILKTQNTAGLTHHVVQHTKDHLPADGKRRSSG